MRHIKLALVVLLILIPGCSLGQTTPSPALTSTPMPGPSNATSPASAPTDPAITPLEWLREKPFQQAQEEAPLILDELPPGFVFAETHSQVMQLPSDAKAQVTSIRYDYTEDGQVVMERHVIITMVGYDNAEGRAEHLDLLATENYEWFYCDINGQQVACYLDPDVQGRVWNSG